MLDLPWYVFALFSAICSPAIVLLEKRGVMREDPLRFTAGIAFIHVVLSAPFLPFVAWERLTLELLGFIALAATLSVIGLTLTAITMKNLGAGEVSSIIALTPAITTIFAFLTLNELPSFLALGGIAFIAAGLVVLEFPRLSNMVQRLPAQHALTYVGLALLVAVVFSASGITDRLVLTSGRVSAFDFIILMQIFMGVLLVTATLCRKEERLGFITSIRRQPVTTISLALIEYVSRISYSQAVSMAYVGLVSALKRTNAVITILLAGRLFHESGVVRKLGAAVLIILGVSAVIW